VSHKNLNVQPLYLCQRAIEIKPLRFLGGKFCQTPKQGKKAQKPYIYSVSGLLRKKIFVKTVDLVNL